MAKRQKNGMEWTENGLNDIDRDKAVYDLEEDKSTYDVVRRADRIM